MQREFERALFWFRRDLRLEDNRGCFQALESSQRVFFLFIFDQNILSSLAREDRRITLIYFLLTQLKRHLEKFKAELLIFQGEPAEIIPRLAKTLQVQCVFTNRDYESYPRKRDQKISQLLEAIEIKFKTFKDQVLFESTEVVKPSPKNSSLQAYTVFTPYKKRFLAKLTSSKTEALRDFSKQTFSLLENNLSLDRTRVKLPGEIVDFENCLAELSFQEDRKLSRFLEQNSPVESLNTFLREKIFSYKTGRDSLYPGQTSRISMFLRFGAISIRRCFRDVLELLENKQIKLEQRESLESWLSELIWREFYSMILQSFPQVEFKAFQPKYQNLPWNFQETLWKAWQNAQTGYPIVDASIRELKETGFMHNRARMITASFLCKDLLHSWQLGEKFFAKYLLDFELSSNNGGWQWAASVGTDAVPYFRVFNPLLQSQRFDPQALYIKNYLPELKDLSPKKIHTLDFRQTNYPLPVVNHAEAKQRAIAFFKS